MNKTEWINAHKEQPDDKKDVLVTDGCFYGIGFYDPHYHFHGGWVFADYDVNEIIFWMELPDLP